MKSKNIGSEKLIQHAENGNLGLVRKYISLGANINYQDDDGWTPLIAASKSGAVDIVKALILNGACLHKKDNMGMNAIMHAADEGHNLVIEEIIQKIIAKNKVSLLYVMLMRDDYKWTTLIHAANNGHLETVKLLIKYGTETIDMVSCEKKNAMMYAANNGYEEIVSILMQHGSIYNKSIWDNENKFPAAFVNVVKEINNCFISINPQHNYAYIKKWNIIYLFNNPELFQEFEISYDSSKNLYKVKKLYNFDTDKDDISSKDVEIRMNNDSTLLGDEENMDTSSD